MSEVGPETVVACLTPPGQAALATLGLHGPRAWDVARGLFRLRGGKELPADPRPGRFWLGRLGEDVADEVVLAVRQTEPVPWLELHGHGGREVTRFLVELLLARGLRLCTWQDFLRRTLGGLRAAAAVALADAPTARTASILLDQYQGALGRALEAILLALDRDDAKSAQAILADLARRAPPGRHLTEPWRVAVAGAPNVGKSSLVNALAGYRRSVVAPTPGTTRDVVTARLAIDGWPVELADTAGVREDAGDLEDQGIRLARTAAASADLCLWVLDASGAPVWPGPEVKSVRLVVNKVDLPPAWDPGQAGDAIRVSAKTGEGVGELCAALGGWLVPEPPPPGAAVAFTPALCAGVEEALGHLGAGRVERARQTILSLRLPGG